MKEKTANKPSTTDWLSEFLLTLGKNLKPFLATAWKVSKRVLIYVFAILYAFTIFGPILVMVSTSFKDLRETFTNPFGIPHVLTTDAAKEVFSSDGSFGVNFKEYTGQIFHNFIEMFQKHNFGRYYLNSAIVILVTLALILIITLLASYVLARYDFKGSKFLYSLFVAGMIIPIKLGTISIRKIMISLGLFDSLWAVILVFTAFGIPFGIFILTVFIRNLPKDLFNAARVDGCSEEGILFRIVMPLIKPAIATVSIVMFIPVWNEFWFPLVLLPTEKMHTIPLATSLLFGKYETNYPLVFAVLTLGSLPVIITYLLFSKAFVKGISAGAIKG